MDGLKKYVEAKMYGMEAKMDVLKKDVEAKMDDVEAKMEANMDGMETNMDDVEAKMDGVEANMDDLKKGMEYLKTNLTKFLQEMLNNDEWMVMETHEEKKINVNHDFVDSNIGSKNHHVLKIDMSKFDGKDPTTWILQME